MKSNMNTSSTPILNCGMQFDLSISFLHILTFIILLQESHHEITGFSERKLFFIKSQLTSSLEEDISTYDLNIS